MMGRRQKLISGDEEDLVYAKRRYRYLKNNTKLVKWLKRQMNKRYRREIKKEALSILAQEEAS